MSGVWTDKSRQRGMTLIELLVVVSIMLLLAVIALPRIRPAMEGRQIRESARAINVFLSKARIAAIQTGRPCGVLFERNEIEPNAATVLRQVEIPPPYAGHYVDSRIGITNSGTVSFPLGDNPVAEGLVREKDVLQLNYQGHLWTIETISGSNWTFSSTTTTANPQTDTRELPFQIYRQPTADSVFGSIAPTLQLPRGVVVDLEASGVGISGQFLTDTSQVILMFSPTGAIDRVHYNHVTDGYGGYRATEPVFLMVGRWERAVEPGAEDGLENWQDLNNLWVAVSPQTGFVTVAEPYGDTTTAVGNVSIPSSPSVSRRFAREAQISKGGR